MSIFMKFYFCEIYYTSSLRIRSLIHLVSPNPYGIWYFQYFLVLIEEYKKKAQNKHSNLYCALNKSPLILQLKINYFFNSVIFITTPIHSSQQFSFVTFATWHSSTLSSSINLTKA